MNPAHPIRSSALEQLTRSTARRDASTDVDFGTRWVDPGRPDRYLRVTWTPKTGELCASDATGSYVRVLAVVQTRDALERILAGWSTVGACPSPPLSWIEERVAPFAPPGGHRTRCGPGQPPAPGLVRTANRALRAWRRRPPDAGGVADDAALRAGPPRVDRRTR